MERLVSGVELHWICENPSHYNDYLFNALALSEMGSFHVHYMMDAVSSHPWKTSSSRAYSSRAFSKRYGVDWLLVRKALRAGSRTAFVVGGWVDRTAISIIVICAFRRRPYLIWTDTPNERAGSGRLYRWMRSTWLKFVFARAAAVMGTGVRALEVLARLGAARSKLIDLPYFTSNDMFTPRLNPEHTKEVVFLSSGRLVNSKKGYDLAIRALGMLRRSEPGLSFRYRIAGVGDDLESLKALAAREGIDQQVEFLGWLEAAELPEFYRSGHIFLHPALYEPYGVAVLEAMASGIVVIGSDATGAVVDRITHMENGYRHRSGSAEDLFVSIQQAVRDPSQLRLVARRARSTAEQWPLTRGVQIVEAAIASCAASRE